MKSESAISVIRQHEAEFKELGVVSLSLFGSTARGEERPDSDVDIAVRFEADIRGLDVFERLDLLKARLSEILETAVDVVPEPTLPGPIKTSIDRDRRIAF